VAVPPRKTRNVSLTSQLDAFVDGRVASGRYRSASEVVRAALRLLEEAETPRREDDVRPPRPADVTPDER
jgi:putative addiction module CopG family antidote